MDIHLNPFSFFKPDLQQQQLQGGRWLARKTFCPNLKFKNVSEESFSRGWTEAEDPRKPRWSLPIKIFELFFFGQFVASLGNANRWKDFRSPERSALVGHFGWFTQTRPEDCEFDFEVNNDTPLRLLTALPQLCTPNFATNLYEGKITFSHLSLFGSLEMLRRAWQPDRAAPDLRCLLASTKHHQNVNFVTSAPWIPSSLPSTCHQCCSK